MAAKKPPKARKDSAKSKAVQLPFKAAAQLEELPSPIDAVTPAKDHSCPTVVGVSTSADGLNALVSTKEVMSINGERETSKEEIQSLNEELSTVNKQLRHKIADLETANKDLANLLNCTDVAILLLDNQARIKRFTAQATRLFNLIATDINRPISDLTTRFAGGTLQQEIEHVLRTLTPHETQVQMKTPDGTFWNRRITPYRTIENRIEGLVLTFTDVTQIKRAADHAQRLAAVLLDSNDAVFVHDFEGRISTWNRGAERMFGYSEAEALMMNVDVTIPVDLRASSRTRLDQLRHGERVDSWESQRRTKDGRIIDVWVTATVLKDEREQPFAIAKTERDVTELKRTHVQLEYEIQRRTTALRKSQEELAAVLYTAADSIITIDAKGTIQSVNTATEQMFGFTAAEMIGHNIKMLMPPPYREEHDRYLETYEKTGEKKIIGIGREVLAQRKDGSTFPVDLAVSAVDHLGLFTGILRDITDRKQATEALKAREAQLRSFVQQAPVAIAMFDRNMNCLAASQNWTNEYGQGQGDLVGLNHYDVHRDLPDRWKENHRKGMAGESLANEEDLWVQVDGTRVWLSWAVRPWLDASGNIGGIMIMADDITARKNAESALRESERFARSTLDGLSAHIAILDESGTILAVNQAWRNFEATSSVGRADLDEGANYLRVCDHSVGPYSDEGPIVAAGIRSVLTHQITEFVLEYPCHSPREERWFLVRVTPFPGDGPRRVVVAHENITKRKELEREVVEIASLEQRRIGQDLHDSVGQELTALNIEAADLAEILQTNPAEAPKLVERIAEGLKSSQRELRSVLRGLLPVAVDSEGLMAALSDLAERVRNDGKAIVTFDCPKTVAVADNLTATHLYLIAQEAVYNAVKHAKPKNVYVSLKADDVLVLSVQDDGIGMQAKASESHGGLGLRIMQNRAAVIGARLAIQPAEPTGTLVTCSLPRKNHEKK